MQLERTESEGSGVARSRAEGKAPSIESEGTGTEGPEHAKDLGNRETLG